MNRLPEPWEKNLVDGDDFVHLYEVRCTKDEGVPSIFHIVDDAGDPEFNCLACDLERNHLRLGKMDKYHTVTRIGKISIRVLRKFIEQKGE